MWNAWALDVYGVGEMEPMVLRGWDFKRERERMCCAGQGALSRSMFA